MRVPRIKPAGGGYYHIISRVVDRRMALNDGEKERFCKRMRAAEVFSGVHILTYAILDSHFHVELYVPARQPVDDQLFDTRMRALYDPFMVKTLMDHIGELREQGKDDAAGAVKAKFVKRMYDLSEFGKTLKQGFTQSFNRRHERKGTLWEERFKSVLIEGSEAALATVAAYIDLNAVRAGIVKDPAQYRYCGYGEAVGGSPRAREGLATVLQTLGLEAGWRRVHAEYRKLVYSTGACTGLSEGGMPAKAGFSREELQEVLDRNGTLTLEQALHCRVRYFTDGLILGSREFVDEAFVRYRDRFSPKRSSGGRRPTRMDLAGLCSARRLQLMPVAVPTG